MFDEKWIEHEDWRLPLFMVDHGQEGTTRVELSRLRVAIGEAEETFLRSHLGAAYARFLNIPQVSLVLNHKPIQPRFFDQWSYPPSYGPRRYHGIMRTPNERELAVEVLAGLSSESSPTTGEYGVYFYCNDRLVAPAMKTIEVGFARGLAGPPHPKISLTKVIVSLKGDAGEMPWNSSKSDISTNHHTFLALHEWLVKVVSDYARVSRVRQGEWPDKVFRHTTGTITEMSIEDAIEARQSFLPQAPPSRPRFHDRIAKANQPLAKRKPWVVPLFEGVVAANAVRKQPIANANWLALNLLEMTMVAAFKTWLVNEDDNEFSDADLRRLLRDPKPSQLLMDSVPLPDATWHEIELLRRDIDRLTFGATIPSVRDQELSAAEKLVKGVLASLFEVVSEA